MAIAPKPFEKVTVVQIIFKLSQCNKYSISLNGIPNDAINWRETPTLCHPREPSNVESVTTISRELVSIRTKKLKVSPTRTYNCLQNKN